MTASSLFFLPNEPLDREILQKQVESIEIRLNDGRTISADQKAQNLCNHTRYIPWSGHEPEYLRSYLTWDYIQKNELDWFSLSNTDMTTAKEFLNYLIDFCFDWDVPTKDTLLNQTDDIGKYLYLCLEHRKCAICNKRADVHHVDVVGMGRNREKNSPYRNESNCPMPGASRRSASKTKRTFRRASHLRNQAR